MDARRDTPASACHTLDLQLGAVGYFKGPVDCSVGDGSETEQQLDGSRRSLMRAENIGQTAIYNCVIDPQCHDSEVIRIREIHKEIDEAVVCAYGWGDLIERFDHGHHPTERFGVRWTVKPETQREIEQRLLELNLERAAA